MHWQWADVFRGLAALLVCAGHLRGAFFVDFGEASASGLSGPWVPLLYMATALGHQAVMIFFVLSGFLVGGSVLRTRAQFSTRGYVIARLSRLWTVLIPALLLTLACDLVLGRIAPEVLDGTLRATWGSTPNRGQHSLGPATFLANVFFVQTLVAPVYGSNGPLWSLAYEFWYYAVFPVIVWVAQGSRANPLGRVAAASGLAVLAWLTPVRMLYGFAIWLMGVVVWELVKAPKRWLQQPLAAAMSWALFIGALAASCARLPWLRSEHADLLVGGSFALLLASLLQQRRQPTLQSRLGALLRFLSRISYSLYATHFPLVLLLGVACGTTHTQWHPRAASLAGFVLALCALCGWGQLVWLMTERHTVSVRSFLSAIFAAGSAGPARSEPDAAAPRKPV